MRVVGSTWDREDLMRNDEVARDQAAASFTRMRIDQREQCRLDGGWLKTSSDPHQNKQVTGIKR